METSRKKQIEELAKVIFSARDSGDIPYDVIKSLSRDLYRAGYRKASDVAKEIFEVIEDKLTDKIQCWMEKAEGIKGQYEAGYLYERISTIEDLLNLLGEIKEKYTEGKS